jgi:HSP20 family protein
MAALVRWSPERVLTIRPFFQPFSLIEEAESMAREAFGTVYPSMDLDMFEEGNELVVKADLPGINRKDLDISIENDILTIKADKSEDTEHKEDSYYYHERGYGHFERCMTLPSRVDAEKVTASLKNGVLVIRMPKTEVPETKKIEVTVK